MKPMLLLLLAALASGLPAQESARGQLDRFADQLQSMSGRFSQTTLDADGFISESSSGEIFFAAPDRFRWRYVDPFPQELVADGERLWHYDEALEQVTVRPQPPAEESPLLVLTRPELLDRFYRIEDSGMEDVIEFRPLAEEAEFERARLFFADGLPVALELNDTFGQLTRLELEGLVRNPELDSALFRFVPPPGADVLEGY
ncbi:LolA family protein [Wenzhouxiangella marina]|uniref:Outer-membrane lipoprotein carrier protein n=1 Tax=Wenzhouxiangella marina TaxID=1579979 RepID=A0A0K0XVW7_9GAMM|nr:outer membrane lipoprotein carrier protein LolA [Wenzhouxiangella marina]AKS41815.1 membrane protein [Wenzhouxiangella marina]MBB6086423.1 outer membrane lipoprotein carrier protein [Wenzhouxiangella marina]